MNADMDTLTGREARITAAWDGLLAGAAWRPLQWSNSSTPPGAASATSPTLRLAAEAIQFLEDSGGIPVHELNERARRLLGPLAQRDPIVAMLDGLVLAIALSLSARSRNRHRLVSRLDDLLLAIEVDGPDRTVILALCLSLRAIAGRGEPREVWCEEVSWLVGLSRHCELREESILLASQCVPDWAEPIESPGGRIGHLLAGVLDDTDFDACMARCMVESDLEGLRAAAGAIFGMRHGPSAIPAQSPPDFASEPALQAARAIITGRAEFYHGRFEVNPDIDSKNCPLNVSAVKCRNGQLLLSIGPGLHATVSTQKHGRLDIRRDMDADIASLAEYGVTELICLLEHDEILDNRMDSLTFTATAHGIEVHVLPIAEDQAIDQNFRLDLVDLRPRLNVVLDQGGLIAVHADFWTTRLEEGAIELLLALEPERDPDQIRAAINQGVTEGGADEDWDLF